MYNKFPSSWGCGHGSRLQGACTDGLDLKRCTILIWTDKLSHPLYFQHLHYHFTAPPDKHRDKFHHRLPKSSKRNLNNFQSSVKALQSSHTGQMPPRSPRYLLHTSVIIKHILLQPHNWNTTFFCFYYQRATFYVLFRLRNFICKYTLTITFIQPSFLNDHFAFLQVVQFVAWNGISTHSSTIHKTERYPPPSNAFRYFSLACRHRISKISRLHFMRCVLKTSLLQHLKLRDLIIYTHIRP